MAGSVDCSFAEADWQLFDLGSQPDIEALCVWHMEVADVLVDKQQLLELLTPTEREVAFRYRQEKHQDRYIIQHGLLRLLLGWYLGRERYLQPFTFNQNKKPYLPDNGCYFNISHTDGHLLIAIGNVQLGIDIERINPDFNYQDIASHYFGPSETEFIAQAIDARQAFFLLWTRKEALLKSSGFGIDDALPLIPAINGRHKLPQHFGHEDWQTQSFLIGDTHIGSVTHPFGKRELRFYSGVRF